MLPEWVLKNCKFAADAHGPMPKQEYFRGENPYGHFLPSKVNFNHSTGTLTIITNLGKVSVSLTPEQAQDFSSVFEKEIRNEYWDRNKNEAVRAIAKQIMMGKGEENKDWFWGHENDGLEIFKREDPSTPIYRISPEELAQKYGIA